MGEKCPAHPLFLPVKATMIFDSMGHSFSVLQKYTNGAECKNSNFLHILQPSLVLEVLMDECLSTSFHIKNRFCTVKNLLDKIQSDKGSIRVSGTQ